MNEPVFRALELELTLRQMLRDPHPGLQKIALVLAVQLESQSALILLHLCPCIGLDTQRHQVHHEEPG